MAKTDVVGLGAMNIDRLYQVDEIVTDGEQTAKNFVSRPGGSAANTVYALAKLGIKSGFVGAVGPDEDGKELLADFLSVDVDTNQIKIKKTTTGSTICLSDKLGRRAIYVSPGANNLLNLKDLNISYLDRTKIVHMSSFADNRQFKLQISLARKLKSPISLAPGMLYAAKGLKALTPLLEQARIIFMNREEVTRLTGKDYIAGARQLIKIGCCIVVITLGRGLPTGKERTVAAYICDNGKEYEVIPEKAGRKSVFETTGAGDAFAAGFLFGFLKGKKTEECGLLGDIMAGFAIEKVGARTGLPTLSQLSREYFNRTGCRL
jgi:ribokinase